MNSSDPWSPAANGDYNAFVAQAEARLWELLSAREAAESDDRREAMENEIRETFSKRQAVIFTDMSGFSKITRDLGIVHFLGLIHRMREMCLPHVHKHGGHLVKTIGDDLVLTFPDPADAVRAAVKMRMACQTDAERRPPEERIRLAMGVGFGDMLDLDGTDVFGDEVNRASKLGEDIAEPGEILLTSSVANEVGDLKGYWLDERNARISGITFDYYAVEQGG